MSSPDSNAWLAGYVPDLPTPFNEAREVDWIAFVRLCEQQVRAGVSAIVVEETASEFTTLTPAELDAIIRTAADTACGRVRVIADAGSKSTSEVLEKTMIAVPLTFPGFSEARAREPSSSPACFEPLDPGIISASIPIFFVGRDRDGFWLVRDAKGERGGIFLLKSSALAFARRAARPLGCATVFPSERFELDVENQGNPLVGYLKPIIRFVTSGWKNATNNAA